MKSKPKLLKLSGDVVWVRFGNSPGCGVEKACESPGRPRVGEVAFSHSESLRCVHRIFRERFALCFLGKIGATYGFPVELVMSDC